MLLIRFENIFVIAIFVLEWPAAVLAALELAVLVDGVIDQVKRRPLSAFGADNRFTFSFAFTCHKGSHFFKRLVSFLDYDLRCCSLSERASMD